MADSDMHHCFLVPLFIVAAVSLAGCESRGSGTAAAQAPGAGPRSAPSENRQAEFGRFPDREFIRRNLDTLTWTATEGNSLGVQSAVLEGDPSKPGFYLIVNRFPPGVMSRPHTHPDERHVLVIKGTWYTGEGPQWTPDKTVGLKPGDYMRHPAGGVHWDGAL